MALPPDTRRAGALGAARCVMPVGRRKYRIAAMQELRLDRLDHLVLAVSDVDRACAFYQRVLGMEVETFGGGRTALRFGRQKINVEKAGPSTPPPAHFCFITDAPLAAWLEHLKRCGVTTLEGP